MKKIFSALSFLLLGSVAVSAQSLSAKEAPAHIGEKVTICGKIFGGRFFENNQKTLLNMGAAYPDNPLTIVIDGTDRKKFSFKPEEQYLNKEVCVTGEVTDYKGKPEIKVTEITQIAVKDPAAKD